MITGFAQTYKYKLPYGRELVMCQGKFSGQPKIGWGETIMEAITNMLNYEAHLDDRDFGD